MSGLDGLVGGFDESPRCNACDCVGCRRCRRGLRGDRYHELIDASGVGKAIGTISLSDANEGLGGDARPC